MRMHINFAAKVSDRLAHARGSETGPLQSRDRKGSGVHERGSALIEFALCAALFWTPLFLGTYQIGFNLIRAVQVTQVCRDAGHMYAQGTDFTATSATNLLNSLMPASFHATSSGNTVIYFSLITFVDKQACVNAGVASTQAAVNTTNCPNLGQAVFNQQIPYGNTSLTMSGSSSSGSTFGTPSASIMSSGNGYNIQAHDQVTNPSAVARNFLSVIPLSQSSEYVYMSEMYVQSSDLNVWQSLGTTGEYARSLF